MLPTVETDVSKRNRYEACHPTFHDLRRVDFLMKILFTKKWPEITNCAYGSSYHAVSELINRIWKYWSTARDSLVNRATTALRNKSLITITIYVSITRSSSITDGRHPSICQASVFTRVFYWTVLFMTVISSSSLVLSLALMALLSLLHRSMKRY